MEGLQIALPENLEDIKLPSPELVNYWRLAENRIFYIDYEIDETVLDIQRSIIAINIADRDIKVEDRVPIKIYLDTPGGATFRNNVIGFYMYYVKNTSHYCQCC